MQRLPQIDIEGHDLVVRIPLENIPNMPANPAGRAVALQTIRHAVAAHAAQKAMAPQMGGGAPPLGSAPPMGGAGPVQGALAGALGGG